eukprot:SM000009S23632  [mRNA]  locus=s9:1324568:1326023:+ [translate_table: standard]
MAAATAMLPALLLLAAPLLSAELPHGARTQAAALLGIEVTHLAAVLLLLRNDAVAYGAFPAARDPCGLMGRRGWLPAAALGLLCALAANALTTHLVDCLFGPDVSITALSRLRFFAALASSVARKASLGCTLQSQSKVLHISCLIAVTEPLTAQMHQQTGPTDYAGNMVEPCSLVLRAYIARTVQSLLSGGSAARVLTVAAVCVVGPLKEELLFRRFLLVSLTKWMPTSAALCGSALAFAVLHGWPRAFLPLSAAGCILGAAYAWTGSLMAPFAIHGAYNAIALALVWRLRPKDEEEEPLLRAAKWPTRH